MTYNERIANEQYNAVSTVFKGIDQAWSGAENAFYQAADSVREKGGYAINNPIAAVGAMGNFATDSVHAAWDASRSLVGNGLMWANAARILWQTPCEDKWSVLIETALPAAGDALWLLLVPSPAEVLENYLQPYPTKNGRRRTRSSDPDGRRNSKSGRVRRAWPAIPDVDEMVANMIPGAQAVKGRPAGAPTRWLFKGIDIADGVSWSFMLMDLTSDFFANWTSNIMQARFCEAPAYAIYEGAADDPRNVPFYNQPVVAYQKPTNLRNVEIANGRIFFQLPPGREAGLTGYCTANVTCSRLSRPNLSASAYIEIRMYDRNNKRTDSPGPPTSLSSAQGGSLYATAELIDCYEVYVIIVFQGVGPFDGETTLTTNETMVVAFN